MASTRFESWHLEEKYESLKKDIVEHVNGAFTHEQSKPHLEKLKLDFSDDVKSIRQLDAVESVAGLIRLLEKRQILAWFRVDPFQNILREYEIDGDTFERYLNYVEVFEKTLGCRNKKAFSTYLYDGDLLREIPNNSEVIPRHISEYICQEMKGKWIAFGKELVEKGLACEGQLDKLIDSNKPIDQKTQELLDSFVKGDKRHKISQLCELISLVNNKLGREVSRKYEEHYKMCS